MDDVCNILHSTVEGAIDGEVWDDDGQQTVTCTKFLDGRVVGDHPRLLFGSYSIAHIVASGKCGEEDTEPDQAAGPGYKKCCSHRCNLKSYAVYGIEV
jgi:hypothetical protein